MSDAMFEVCLVFMDVELANSKTSHLVISPIVVRFRSSNVWKGYMFRHAVW
jgi:hypothetical protein